MAPLPNFPDISYRNTMIGRFFGGWYLVMKHEVQRKSTKKSRKNQTRFDHGFDSALRARQYPPALLPDWADLAFGILAHRKKHYLHVRTRPLRRKFRADSENGPKKFRAVVERSRFWRVRIKFNIPPALRKNNPKFIDWALRSEFGIWPPPGLYRPNILEFDGSEGAESIQDVPVSHR